MKSELLAGLCAVFPLACQTLQISHQILAAGVNRVRCKQDSCRVCTCACHWDVHFLGAGLFVELHLQIFVGKVGQCSKDWLGLPATPTQSITRRFIKKFSRKHSLMAQRAICKFLNVRLEKLAELQRHKKSCPRRSALRKSSVLIAVASESRTVLKLHMFCKLRASFSEQQRMPKWRR